MAPFIQIQAQDNASAEESLEIFFKLGLPDTKGAKWVEAHGGKSENDPYSLDSAVAALISGNAWQIGEVHDGGVEIVVSQSKRIRAHPVDQTALVRQMYFHPQSVEDAVPAVFLKPASLERAMAQWKAAFPRRRPNPSHEDGSKENAFRDDRPIDVRALGQMVLFLAHLERQGRRDFVREMLPLVLAQAPSPQDALDAAASVIADERVAQLSEKWIANSDSEAFATALEALVSEFPQGWDHRSSALQLAQRARLKTASPDAEEPAVREIANLLLAMSPKQLEQIHIDRNWLLPKSLSDEPPFGDKADEEAAATSSSALPASREAIGSDPLSAFFAGKFAAAEALTHLLGDHRLIRKQWSPAMLSFGENNTAESAPLPDSYQTFQRPMEVGEMARILLDVVLPPSLREGIGRENSAGILAWLREVFPLSDEQLVWLNFRTLQASPGASDPALFNSLMWLVTHGGKDTISALKEVFLQGPLWQNQDDGLFFLLEPYLQRMGDDRAAFEQLLSTEYRLKVDEEHFKALQELLKPRNITEILEEIAKGYSYNPAGPMTQSALSRLSIMPAAEAEREIFRAAVKAGGALGFLDLMTRLPSANPLFQAYGHVPRPKAPEDPETLAAVKTFLTDERSYEPTYEDTVWRQTVAAYVARLLVTPRLSLEEWEKLSELSELLPPLASSSVIEHARALVSRMPAPPWPEAAHVSEKKLQALASDLAARPPEEIFSVFTTLAPDEQFALARHFSRVAQLPPALIAARFAISSIRTDSEEPIAGLDTAHWTGRPFDDAFCTDLSEFFEKNAGKGLQMRASLKSPSQFSALSLTFDNSGTTYTTGDLEFRVGLKGIKGKPAPVAIVTIRLQNFFYEGGDAGELTKLACSIPVWKEAAINEAWKKEFLNPSQKPSATGGAGTSEITDFAEFREALMAIFEQCLEARSAFRMEWTINPVTDDPKP